MADAINAHHDDVRIRRDVSATDVQTVRGLASDRRRQSPCCLTDGRYDAGRTMIAGTVKSCVLPKLRIAIPKLFA